MDGAMVSEPNERGLDGVGTALSGPDADDFFDQINFTIHKLF